MTRIFLICCLVGCATPKQMTWVSSSSQRFRMPAGQEALAPQFQDSVRRAADMLHAFARTQGWQAALEKPLFDSVEVFDEQAALFRRVLELNGLSADTPMPTRGLVAGIEGRVLVVLTPQAFASVQPDYAKRAESWERLVAHEMAHRMHVELVAGNEDAMGPQWLFEGLATLASGQNLDEGLTFHSSAEALAAAHDKASPLAYRRFAAAVRYFSSTTPLPELVRLAGRADFEDTLIRAKETHTR